MHWAGVHNIVSNSYTDVEYEVGHDLMYTRAVWPCKSVKNDKEEHRRHKNVKCFTKVFSLKL